MPNSSETDNQTSLFQRIVDETNLRKAWIKSRHYATTSAQYFDKLAYDSYDRCLEENLQILRHVLVKGIYQFSPLRTLEIPKGDDTRKIYFLLPKDAIVAQAIINVIGPIFELDFTESNFGYRLNIVEESEEPFKFWPEQYNLYASRVRAILVESEEEAWYQISDIENFFPSVNLSALKSLIAANIQDTQLLLLINQLIDNQALDLDETVQIVDGLPPGPAHSYFFANIYLGMFDKFMEARTLKYSRYVDDFVFVCANEEELHRLNDELSRFINENIYARLSLRLSNAKTITKRVTNILPLLEHTRKLKYDLRFGVIEEISGESATNSVEDVQRNAEALFRDLFIRVEKEEDITRIAKESSGLIAKCLTELIVSKREARNIAYGLLELNPPRVTAIRALISSLIELSFDDEKALERYMEFIKEASDITKLTFLQILLGHREIPICVETLITDLLTSNNYLVRANAFLVLRSNEVPISLQKFREYREYETSDYVLKHIINCLPLCDSHSQQPIWVEILAILDDCSSDVLIAILLVLDELIQINKISRDSFEIIFPAIHQHPHDSLFSDSIKLLLVSLYGNTSMIRAVWKSIKQYGESISHRIIQVISSKVIRHLSEQKKTSQLFLYSDTLASLELSLQATVGYQELASRSPNPQLTAIARSKQSEIGVSLGIPGLPSWYSLIDNDKGFFCGLSEEPHYRCRYFDDQAQEIKGTLEIISEERLKPNESFASIDMWKNYLEHLNTNEVISLIECGVLPDSSFYALYEIPPGFMTIRDWLKKGQFLSGEVSILKIASKIVGLIENTEIEGGFHFTNVNPCNVIWSPEMDEVRLINIGSSLSIPRYVCSRPGCSKPALQNKIGPTTGSYFMGLLLFQLISDNCPINALYTNKGSSKNGKSIIDVLGSLELSPHTRSIIARLLDPNPEYRYSKLTVLKDDIDHILIFKDRCQFIAQQIESEERNHLMAILSLVDFVTFRFKVARRNPLILDESPLLKTKEILNRLSKDLSYYNQEDLSIWKEQKDWWTNRKKLPSYLDWRYLNPEAKHLLSVAHKWSDLINKLRSDLQVEYEDILSCMLITWAIYEELVPTIQGVFLYNRTPQNLYDDCKHVVESIINAETSLKQVKLCLRQDSNSTTDPITNVFTDGHLVGALETIRISQSNINWHFSRAVQSISSLFSIITLFIHQYDIVGNNDETIISTTSLLSLHPRKRPSPNIWVTMKQPVEIENEIGSMTDPHIDNIQNTINWWQLSRETFAFLRRLNPCLRRVAVLSKYSPISSPMEGKLSFSLFPWIRIEKDFSEFSVYILGDMTRSIGNKIRADIVKRDADYRVSSVFASPKLFRVLMPPPKNFLRSTKQFIQERWKMVLIALVALLGSFVAEFLGVDAAKIANQWIGNEMWARLLIAVVWVLRALAFTVFASFIYAKYFEKTK